MLPQRNTFTILIKIYRLNDNEIFTFEFQLMSKIHENSTFKAKLNF